MGVSFQRGVILPGGGEAQVVDTSGVRPISVREFSNLDRFAAELTRCMNIPVVVEEHAYTPSPSDLVLCERGSAFDFFKLAPDFSDRCVIFNIKDPLETAIRHRVAAVVDHRSYQTWKINYSRFRPSLVGLRAVLHFAPDLQESDEPLGEYVSLVGGDSVTLPELLACYIEAYARYRRRTTTD